MFPKQRKIEMGLITAENLPTIQRKLRVGTRLNILGQSGNAGGKRGRDDPPNGQQVKKHRKEAGVGGGQSTMVFDKGFGQHILKNPLVTTAIVEKAAIKSTDVVLEIGPGTGNLTEKLLLAAKKVIAFEIDPRMVAELTKRFQNSPLQSKLEIIKGNCLEFDFPYFDKCVANVPYAISSALIFKLLKKPNFKCAILMFQREFALRVCAQPGSEAYCRLSVNSQLLARCSHLMKISKNSFNPPPKVESSVIRLDPKHPPPAVDFEDWDGLVKLVFNRKNKKVSSVFKTKNTLNQLYDSYCTRLRMEGVAVGARAAAGAPAAQTVKEGPFSNGEGLAFFKTSRGTPIPANAMSIDSFKEMLDGIVGEGPLFERRGIGLNLEEMAQLLHLFNGRGIHFFNIKE